MLQDNRALFPSGTFDIRFSTDRNQIDQNGRTYQ